MSSKCPHPCISPAIAGSSSTKWGLSSLHFRNVMSFSSCYRHLSLWFLVPSIPDGFHNLPSVVILFFSQCWLQVGTKSLFLQVPRQLQSRTLCGSATPKVGVICVGGWCASSWASGVVDHWVLSWLACPRGDYVLTDFLFRVSSAAMLLRTVPFPTRSSFFHKLPHISCFFLFAGKLVSFLISFIL